MRWGIKEIDTVNRADGTVMKGPFKTIDIEKIENVKIANGDTVFELDGEWPTDKFATIPPLDVQIRAEDRIDEAMRIFFEEME